MYLRAWQKVLKKRLLVLGCGLAVTDFELQVLLLPRLVALPLSPAMMVVRTLVNSWVTTHRFHSEVRFSCLFGCGSIQPLVGNRPADSLSHYLACPTLWRIVEAASLRPSGLGPADRLGITDSAPDLRLIAVAYMTYNHLRHHSLGHYHGHTSYSDLAETRDCALRAAAAAVDFIFAATD